MRSSETLSRDLSYAVRTLAKNPLFAIVAVLVLALGIGANTACFSVIRAVLLQPLSYSKPDELVIISGGATPVRFDETKSAAHSFTAIGAFTGQENLTLTGTGEPQILKAARVSATSLRILKVIPLLGRSFLPQEDTPGGASVAMISAEFWEKQFRGDLHVIGNKIDLAGSPYTIVGVLPHQVNFPFPGLDVWLTKPSEWPAIAPKSRPLSPFLTIFGRLNPDVSMQQANAEIEVLQHQYARNHPAMLDAKPKSPVHVQLLKDHIVANVRSELWMLFGAVGLVLLIACANLASLLLARAHARSREFALRAAIGAGRSQLVRQLLTESLLLSLLGGAFGILFALMFLKVLRSVTVWTLPRTDEIYLHWTVLIFAALLACATGILAGLMPALDASRSDLMALLRARTSGSSQHSFGSAAGFGARGVLVIGQIALSTMLLIGAALLIESVIHLRSENLGFDPAGLLTARVSLPPQRYDTDQKRTAFFDNLAEDLKVQPGIRQITAAMTLPMTGYAGTPVQDADKPVLRLNERPIATILIVSTGYFDTLKIPLKRGRTFTDRDRDGAQRVTVIDEGLARRFWPSYPSGEDPVGHRLLIGGINLQPVQIIGIVGNVHQNLENSAWPQSVYVALAQNALPSVLLAIRTPGAPLHFTSLVRDQVHRLDRDQPVSDVQTMDDLVESELGERRVIMALLASFAGVATLLAVIGIYGITAYAVTERTQEIGIRRALGAYETDVLWLIFRQALLLALVGTLAGLVGAATLTRLMKTLLFHVNAADPTTMAGIAASFIVVTIAASYLPARRATRVDPTVALRYE